MKAALTAEQIASLKQNLYRTVAQMDKLNLLTGDSGVSVWDSPEWSYLRETYVTQDSLTLRELQRAALTAIYTPETECVIIYGPSGSGKELLARVFAQGGKKFVAVNCTSLPDYLVESELFGHKKGAFTGAVDDRVGLFLEAGNGVLFIDEIGDMPLTMQAKLLRALQERRVRPVGNNVELKVTCRVVCATHRRIPEMVQNGTFREDLYWRLSTHEFTLSALDTRPDDIALYIARNAPDVPVPRAEELASGNYRALQRYISRYRLSQLAARAGTPPAK